MTAAATPASPSATDRWSAWSDRLNPILVREVQQAVKNRVFALSIMVALVITVIIATVVAGSYDQRPEAGRTAFDAGLATLVPLLLFVVPMQAYQSMRLELRSGIVEQLLLSRLSPRAILVGKLEAAMVQFVLYVAVLAPLLATSYLLRGVDLPTIGVSLTFALLMCLLATAFAVSSAAQGVLPALQPIANLAIAMGLGVATIALIGYVSTGEYARDIGWLMRSAQFATAVSAAVLLGAASGVMSLLVAQCFLQHAFENRSSGFRVFLFVCPLLAYGWLFAFIEPVSRPQAFVVLTVGLFMVGVAFAIFMSTEQRVLSPRVRAYVPRRAIAALLAAPFLPGRDRGMLCYWSYSLLLAGIAAIGWPRSGHLWTMEVGRATAMQFVYALVYLGLLRWLRGRLPETLGGNHVGRFLLPVLLFFGCIVPLLIDVFLHGGVDDWHAGHVMNPFWTIVHTIDRSDERWQAAVPWLVGAGALAVLLQLRALFTGVREVLAASRVRRERGQGG